LSNEGWSLRAISFDSPRDCPLIENKNRHVTESTEEKDLLRDPFEEEIDVILKMQRIQSFQENG
jgi:hypothetical protein